MNIDFKKIDLIAVFLIMLPVTLLLSCTNNTTHNKTLPIISIECQASDWNPYAGTFNLKISYKGTSSPVNTSTLDVVVNNSDVTSLLTIDTDIATGTVTGLSTCDGVNVFATIKDETGTLTSASCSLPALAIAYPVNNSTISDPLPSVSVIYATYTTDAEFSVTMDSKDITGDCITGTTLATCQIPFGQYITPGTHSISSHRCFATGGPCCDKSSTFTFVPPVPSVNILKPSGYISSTTANIDVLFSDTTNKLGLDQNGYNISLNGSNVTGQFITTVNSTLSNYGYSNTPTSFMAVGSIGTGSIINNNTITASVTNLFYGITGTASKSFSVDTTPPFISIAEPVSGSTSGSSLPYYIYPNVTIPYAVMYSDTQSGVNQSSFKININGIAGAAAATGVSATGTLSATLPVSSGSNGSGMYTIAAQVSDNVGNTATTSSVITLSLANIGIDSATATAGTQFVVPINVFIDPSHAYGLGSYNISINFNQNIINFVSVSGSASGYPGVAYTPEFAYFPNYYATSSGIDINSTNQSGSGYYPNPVGLFNIANLTFYAASPGTTALTITVNSLYDTTGTAVPSSRVQSGTVTVQ